MKTILSIIICIFLSQYTFAQVGIGTTSVHQSAVLELKSEEKGFLLPRMTFYEMEAISNPATGLTVFNLTEQYVNYYNGTCWQSINSSHDPKNSS